MTLTEPKHFKCIYVDFLGSAHVEWYRRIAQSYTKYVNTEKYVNEYRHLWSPSQSSSGSIGPGSFSFRFQFVIPSHVPSSFYDEYTGAYISYEIKARAANRWVPLISDYKDSVTVYILQRTSISEANLTTPISVVKRKQLGCLCCAAGTVEFVAKLPRTGYCITNRDTIPLVVDVQNNSRRVIELRAKIVQKISMFMPLDTNVCRRSVAVIYSLPIQPGESFEWNPANWSVSKLSPTILNNGCSIMRVEYTLEVSAIIPKTLNLRCKIPLFLGTLPYTCSGEGLERALLGAIIAVMVRAGSSADTHDNDIEKECNDHNTNERDTLI